MLRDYGSGERKIDSYYRHYDTHFEARKNDEMNVLEIGIQHGGSLRMWTKYFANGKVTGVDNDPHCKDLDVNGATVVIGDQSNPEFLAQFVGFDIIIDDGGHTMEQQQVSFKTLFPLLKQGGIYVIEDLHTSYWPEFQDAPVRTTDFIASLIHSLNADAMKSPRSGAVNDVVAPYQIAEVHNYESMCFIYKK